MKSLVFLWLVVPQLAIAAGFEKNIMWSGRHGGIGGAAVSSVDGSEALVFNPAGLISSHEGHQGSLHLSPTLARFGGPVTRDRESLHSSQAFSPVYSALYSYSSPQKWAVGAGLYVAGGTSAEFSNLEYSGVTAIKPSVKSKFSLQEFSVGGAYEFAPGWKAGAAWRIGMASGSFASVTRSSATIIQAVQLEDLKGTNYAGFRVGMQYQPEEAKWGAGLNIRTDMKYKAKGVSQGQLGNGSTPVPLTGESASLTTHFPMQIALGGHMELVPDEWRGYAEYAWTNYSINDEIDVEGRIGVGSPSTKIPNIQTKWHDQHNLRLAAEYLKWEWILRFGYVLTTAVTDEERARATFSAPGYGHTFTAGTGYSFTEQLRMDAAYEYSFIRGEVEKSAQAETKLGSYTTDGHSLHLSMNYNF